MKTQENIDLQEPSTEASRNKLKLTREPYLVEEIKLYAKGTYRYF